MAISWSVKTDMLVVLISVLLILNILVLVFDGPALWLADVIIVFLGGYFYYELQKKNKIDLRNEEKHQATLKRIEADSREYETKLAMLVNHIPSPIAFVNEGKALEIYNPSFRRFIKGEKSELILSSDENLNIDVAYFLKEALEKTENYLLRLEIEGIEYQALSIVIKDDDHYFGNLMIFQDITKAVNDEKLQKQFIADASHELKTPISVLKGMLEILGRPDFDDKIAQEEFIGQMNVETLRLERLVKDLLELSKVAADKEILVRQEVDVRVVIDAVIKSLSPLYRDRDLKISNRFSYPKTIYGDADKLYVLFNNLLLNAIQNTTQGEISIDSEEDGNYLIINVSDTGSGIAKEQLNNLFQRFYRDNSDRSRQSGGTGLGLAIVKAIAEAHNGSVEISSEENLGTKVTIKLTKS